MKKSEKILVALNNEPSHLVCDSRALTFIMNDPDLALTNHEDWGKFIILAGETAYSACKACNDGEYGNLCIPVDSDGDIMWGWYRGDWKWEANKKFPSKAEFIKSMELLISDYKAYVNKIVNTNATN